MAEPDLDLLPWLAGLVHRRDDRGRLLYSKREVEDFLAALVCSMGFSRREISDRLARMLTAFAARTGVEPGASADVRDQTLRDYFREHPLRKDLVIEFRRLYRESLIDANVERSRRAFAHLLRGAGDRPHLG